MRGIDDEGAVEALVDVALQRHRVAVIEVQAERLGVELVDESIAGHHLVLGQRAVHLRRMPAVEMDRVGVGALIQEIDADPIPFGGAQRRTRHLAVERPCREEHAGRDLDLAIDGHQVVFTQQRTIGPRSFAIVSPALGGAAIGEIPRAQEDRRIEGVERHAADRPGEVRGVRVGPGAACR